MGGEQSADDYRIAVSVARPDQLDQLMRTAIDVAADHGGDILVVSVVVEPRASPFRVFEDQVIKEEFDEERRDILDRALAVAEDSDVPVDGRLVVADSAASGIVEAATVGDVDAILMGWHARSRQDIVMGHTVDDVVAAAPCDVLVEKIGPTADGVDSIFMPAGADRHTTLAAGVARAIAQANDASVDVMRVVPPNATRADRGRAADIVEGVAGEVGPVPTETHVVEAGDVPTRLVTAAERRDLTVIGGGGRARLHRFVVGSTAREVGRRAETTVVVATRNSGVRSRLARLVT